MSTETIKVEIDTVADLTAVLERIEDKAAKLTVNGSAGGCHSCSEAHFDRQIREIEVNSWEQFTGMVELKI